MTNNNYPPQIPGQLWYPPQPTEATPRGGALPAYRSGENVTPGASLQEVAEHAAGRLAVYQASTPGGGAPPREERIRERVFSIDRLIEHVGCGSVDDAGCCPIFELIRAKLRASPTAPPAAQDGLRSALISAQRVILQGDVPYKDEVLAEIAAALRTRG